jgi:hypothetical protein
MPLVNLYDIFKMGSDILSVKNQFLLIGVKFYSKNLTYIVYFKDIFFIIIIIILIIS